MARVTGGCRYSVLDAKAPRRAAERGVWGVAMEMRQDAALRTPVRTGLLQSSWQVQKGRLPAVYKVINEVEYARFVEFGTRRTRAHPMLGPARASAAAKYGR